MDAGGINKREILLLSPCSCGPSLAILLRKRRLSSKQSMSTRRRVRTYLTMMEDLHTLRQYRYGKVLKRLREMKLNAKGERYDSQRSRGKKKGRYYDC